MNPNPEIGYTLEVQGLPTNYHDRGSGPAVLLLHGSGPGVSAWANWRNTIPALEPRFRVLAPDLAGFGYTRCSDSVCFDLEFWLNHLLAFLDALELERVSIVGNSFGGALALALAVKKPARVNDLVLMGSAGVQFELTPGLEAVWGYEPSLQNMRAIVNLFPFDSSFITEELINARYVASTAPGAQDDFSRMFPPPRQDSVNMLAQGEDAIREIRARTLIIHGREDKIVPVANSFKLNQLICDSELHVFGRCGHWVQIEKRSRFNDLVDAFLNSEK